MKIVLDGTPQPLGSWRRIYRDGWRPVLGPAARERVDKAARLVAALAEGDQPIYGVNTGFGKLAQIRIAEDGIAELQRNLILSHSTGVGPALPAAIVRLIMALKLASLARGASGVRWEILVMLERMLAEDLLPVIPAQGSVGASGDLAPLAHLSAALLGFGEAHLKGALLPAAEALSRIGLAPVTLGAKEGLALINGTQVSTALALAGLFQIERVFRSALVAGALTLDAVQGTDGPFDERLHALRGLKGQSDVAAALRGLTAGSAIRAGHKDCDKVQDPYSLRCQPQVMGACLDLLRNAAATLTIEASAVTDNPLVFPETGEILSGGNFHAEPVAFVADMLALACAEIGAICERRIAMLTDPVMSGLPPFLALRPGLDSGFMIAHVTAAALTAENRQRAAPCSVDSLPTSANQEDHVSMATHGARRLLDMAANAARIVGIEAMIAANGIEYHAPLLTSPVLLHAMQAIRARIAPWREDRFLAPDLAAAAALVEEGELIRPAAEVLARVAVT
jgi:histidine ammonia-lyase